MSDTASTAPVSVPVSVPVPVPPMHGWYSTTAAKLYGYNVYRTQDGQSEIHVTQVSSDPNSFYGFADKYYVGLVGSFVREGFRMSRFD